MENQLNVMSWRGKVERVRLNRVIFAVERFKRPISACAPIDQKISS